MKKNNTTEKIMKILHDWIKENNYPPTLRELAKVAGLKSTWTVRYHLKKLSSKGLINIKNGQSRGIKLIKGYGIPILGNISAGKPIDAIENVDSYITSIADLFGTNDIFALKIKGDSMKEAGIFNGDIVIVKKQVKVENGDIVAVLIDNEATVKRFYKENNFIKLLPENPKFDPIIIKDNNIDIVGKVIGVIRKL